MFSDDDTFTPTDAQVRNLRDFLTLTEEAERPTLRTRKPRVERHGVAHRETTRRPSAATMFHRLDVCDLIG